jgi:hypothetical protein
MEKAVCDIFVQHHCEESLISMKIFFAYRGRQWDCFWLPATAGMRSHQAAKIGPPVFDRHYFGASAVVVRVTTMPAGKRSHCFLRPSGTIEAAVVEGISSLQLLSDVGLPGSLLKKWQILRFSQQSGTTKNKDAIRKNKE